METGRPYALLVSLVGGKPVRYQFDQDRVTVGRGWSADMRIEHAAVSRTQFLIERSVGSAGEPRYRIVPYDVTNPTYVNDRPAVEGTLTPGDVVAVGDVRIVLERKVQRALRPKRKEPIPPVRAVLLGVATLAVVWGGWLLFGGSGGRGGAELAGAQTKLFQPSPEVRCGNPVECDTRAHDAYVRGKKYLTQVGADPGNLYRAALELEKAARFRQQSGRPLADMADVEAQLAQARARAEAEFQDAKFRLSRAIAAGDLRRCAAEAALLARIVPDETHPYRVKLDAYRRTLPRPQAQEPGGTL